MIVAPAGGRIVVGVDGSSENDDALRWANEEARRRGAALDVVHAWELPALGDPVGMAAADPVVFLHAAEHRLSSVVDLTLGDHPGVEVRQTVVNGEPVRTLLDRAAGADLLVVGSHGRGGFAGLLLGSVSRACLSHAPCPVAVIRPAAPDA